MPVAKLSTGIDLYFECHGHGEPIVSFPGKSKAWLLPRTGQLQQAKTEQNVYLDCHFASHLS